VPETAIYNVGLQLHEPIGTV